MDLPHSNSAPTQLSQKSSLEKSLALIRQRCPRCCKGKIFTGQFAMNDPCPVCGMIFQREEGYFLGAMYVSFVLGTFMVGGGFFLIEWLFPTWSEFLVLGVVISVYLLLVPAVFRYARTIWIYYDRWTSPGDISAGAYEKARAVEFASRDNSSPR
jgi:uncharacterized protein (DUF983 family)